MAAGAQFEKREIGDHVSVPRNPAHPMSLEQLKLYVAQLFEQELGRSISLTQNYLETGADSIQLLGVMLKIEEHIGGSLYDDIMFTSASIEELSTTIWNQMGAKGQIPADNQVLVRSAEARDIAEICDLIQGGFRNKHIEITDRQRLFNHPWDRSQSNWGFVLTFDGKIVGFIGTIYSQRYLSGKLVPFCNFSSWYVHPKYRGLGGLLLKTATQQPHVFYTSFTPGRAARAMLPFVGFNSFVTRVRWFPPLTALGTLRNRAPYMTLERPEIRRSLNDQDRQILDDHALTDLLHVLIREDEKYAYLIVKRRPIRLKLVEKLIPLRMPLHFSEVFYCSDPILFARHFERIKLAVLWQQKTIAFAARERILPKSSLGGINVSRHYLYRSKDITPDDLDTLYSELVLLPL